MQNDIHNQAEALAEEFRALGRSVTVSHSINRNGDASSYLVVSGIRDRIRVSDHYSNTTDAVDAFGSAEEMVAAYEEAAKSAAEKRAAELAERDAREAPFKARFKACKPHEEGDIIVECYPHMIHDKAARREVRARWAA